MFVRAVIIQDQVQLQFFGKFLVQSAQKSQKLLVAMPGKALADDFSFQYFQGREERRGAVTDIIMSVCAATPFLERQSRLRAVQRLYLALLVDTQDQAFFWRIEVEANHIRQFFQKKA